MQEAQTNISSALTAAEPGREVDGTDVGREAVQLRLPAISAPPSPRAAIDAVVPPVGVVADS
jgi:hypothetical protein